MSDIKSARDEFFDRDSILKEGAGYNWDVERAILMKMLEDHLGTGSIPDGLKCLKCGATLIYCDGFNCPTKGCD